MKYKVLLALEFKKEFYKLPREIQEIARKKLQILETRLIGIPLKYDLAGFYSIHFYKNKYRIIYAVENKIVQVLVVHIGKRTDNFYDKLSDVVRKRKSQLRQGNSLSLSDLFK